MSKAFVACADVRRRWSVNTSACLQPFTREANVSRETRCLWRSRWYCRVRSCEVSRCAIEQLTKKRLVSAFSFQWAFPFEKSTARRIRPCLEHRLFLRLCEINRVHRRERKINSVSVCSLKAIFRWWTWNIMNLWMMLLWLLLMLMWLDFIARTVENEIKRCTNSLGSE